MNGMTGDLRRAEDRAARPGAAAGDSAQGASVQSERAHGASAPSDSAPSDSAPSDSADSAPNSQAGALTNRLAAPESRAMNEQAALVRTATVKTGRPTREIALRRQEDLLECALEMFSAHGFELTTIDAIAGALNMTKRTIYARYKDKAALFEAAVKRAIERWFIPLETLRALDTGERESTLIAIGRIRLGNNLSAEGARLQRIVTAEAFRFPEVYRSYDSVTMTVIHFLAEIFEKHRDRERGDWFADSELAASAFLSMVNAPARRAILSGRTPRAASLDGYVEKAVGLFLNGLRPRP
jgi:AcrR family transcriptional regulator